MAPGFLKAVLQPYPLLMIVLGLWGLRLFWVCRNHRRFWCMGAIAYACLYWASNSIVAHFVLSSLEHGSRRGVEKPGPADVIVVLTGNLRRADAVRPVDELADTSLYRCHHAARLYHSQSCRIIVSGGKVDPSLPGRNCADVMRDCLIELGVRPSDITTETESRTTGESAVQCRKILAGGKDGRVILVTEAFHMRRSIAAFEHAGLLVEPSPCMFRAGEFRWKSTTLLPSVEALAEISLASHEIMGMVWYRLKRAI